MKRTQYRVYWERTAPKTEDGPGGVQSKQKKFGSLVQAKQRIQLLTSDEPWRLEDPNAGPDDYRCCGGGPYTQCGCGGQTNREYTDELRKSLPPITKIRIDTRVVTTTPWELVDEALWK